MKGDIYTSQKCPACGSKMLHDPKRGNCFCIKCDIPASKGYFVRFGRDICKRFSKNYLAADQFLNGLRFKTSEGTYDRRDYQKDFPLGFANQADRWLQFKKKKMKHRSWQNIANMISKAAKVWKNTNAKMIGYAQIEDFLYDPKTTGNDKTRANIRSCLHDFFSWLKKREGIPVPDMPECPYELGWRNYTDWETQGKIIDEVRRQNTNNPKIVFAIELLASYGEFRPDDLRRITESDFDEKNELVIVRNPTKKKNQIKVVRLLPDHASIWKSLKDQYPGLPHMPFFRHIVAHQGVKANEIFGVKFLYKKFKNACKRIGIEGLDLYGATRHTTTTELAKIAGRDNAKKFTGHDTNKAFERYCQAQDDTAFEMAKIVAKKKGKKADVIDLKKRES